MIRTHEAGTLRAGQDGQTVTLAGWVARRRDHGGVTFIDLRDASGIVQVVFRGEGEDGPAHALRAEFCVKVTGQVRSRPAGNENPELPTGEIEVAADELEVLAEADPLPFPIDGTADLNEEARLRYRYLDMRRPETAAALRVRSEATYFVTEVLRRHRFVYVETPDLTRSTPEGARDFLVPVRLRPGHWYALPQSPQLFKQLLMVGGMERYWQLARCFRDEDFRADRQPEFTQIDIEMSFITREDVVEVAEDLVGRLWSEVVGYQIPGPIPQMTYADAMARFGSDKPDLRFGLELTDLTSYFAQSSFRVFQAPYVGAVVMPGGASQARRELDNWQEWAKARGARGLAYVLIDASGAVSDSGPVAKHLSAEERTGLAAAVGAGPGDSVFFAAGTPQHGRSLLGAARLEIGHRLGLIDPDAWAFTWVVDAPMFEEDGDGRLDRGAPPLHRAPAGMGGQVHRRAGWRPGGCLRPGVQRQRDRRRLDPYPPARHAAEGVRRHRAVPGGGPVAVRLPARRAALRAAPARRHRVRLGPPHHAAGRAGHHPRRDRLPQGSLWRRPAHRGAHAHHRRAAARGGHRRGRAAPGRCRPPEPDRGNGLPGTASLGEEIERPAVSSAAAARAVRAMPGWRIGSGCGTGRERRGRSGRQPF